MVVGCLLGHRKCLGPLSGLDSWPDNGGRYGLLQYFNPIRK